MKTLIIFFAIILGFVPVFAFGKDYGIMDMNDLHLSIVSVSATGMGTEDRIHYTDDIPRKPIMVHFVCTTSDPVYASIPQSGPYDRRFLS